MRFWIAAALAAIAGLGLVKLGAADPQSPDDATPRMAASVRPAPRYARSALFNDRNRNPGCLYMIDSHHIVFAGGGTAGHLFPGLAVAEALLASGSPLRITVIGGGKPLERAHAEAAGYEYVSLPCRPLPKRPGEALRFLTDNLSAYYTARRFLRAEDVSLVVGLGGYVSAAATRAAASRRVDYLLLEQNVIPGKTTRWLAARASAVCAAFGEVRAHLPTAARVRVTGTPVRGEFLRSDFPILPIANANHPPRLIVLGGSGGSRTLNESVPRAIYKARTALAEWQIVHQTGGSDWQPTATLYGKLGLKARVAPFFHDLPRLLAGSALAVSRAGGSTLAELAICGVPSILLPYPQAADDHQRHNAERFVAAGAARLLDFRQVEGRLDDALARELTVLAGSPDLRRQMSDAGAPPGPPRRSHAGGEPHSADAGRPADRRGLGRGGCASQRCRANPGHAAAWRLAGRERHGASRRCIGYPRFLRTVRAVTLIVAQLVDSYPRSQPAASALPLTAAPRLDCRAARERHVLGGCPRSVTRPHCRKRLAASRSRLSIATDSGGFTRSANSIRSSSLWSPISKLTTTFARSSSSPNVPSASILLIALAKQDFT